MKRSRFTERQIVGILKAAQSGVAVRALCRKHGISAATFYRWKTGAGALRDSQRKRLRELKAKRAWLKNIYATFALENVVARMRLGPML